MIDIADIINYDQEISNTYYLYLKQKFNKPSPAWEKKYFHLGINSNCQPHILFHVRISQMPKYSQLQQWLNLKYFIIFKMVTWTILKKYVLKIFHNASKWSRIFQIWFKVPTWKKTHCYPLFFSHCETLWNFVFQFLSLWNIGLKYHETFMPLALWIFLKHCHGEIWFPFYRFFWQEAHKKIIRWTNLAHQTVVASLWHQW